MKLRDLFILLLICIALPVLGQNNPYKIDDRMYTLFLKINKEFGSEQCLKDINTMFKEAGAIHDQKAQCIALVQKVKHYYRVRPFSEIKLREAITECKRFSEKTSYKQYYFNSWTSLIIYYLNAENYNGALAEIKQFQKDALRMKNDYGIAESYRQFGHLFTMVDIHEEAISQYSKCIDYLTNHGNEKQAYELYLSIAENYYRSGKYDKGMEYAMRYINKVPAENNKLKGYLTLLSYMPDNGDKSEATRYYNAMTSLKKKYGLGITMKDYYYGACFQYYTIMRDPVKALSYSDSLGIQRDQDRKISANYYSLGDYKNAYDHLHKFVNSRDSINSVKIGQTISLYTAQFGLEQLEMERRQLELRNSQILLENERRSLLEQRTRDSLNYVNQNLQYHNEHQKHVNDSLHYQKEHDTHILEVKAQNARIQFLAVIFLFVLIGGIIFMYNHFLYTSRLKKEKKAVEDALQVSRKAEKFKSMFLNNMSHEIRTPLNAIVGFTEMLNTPDAGLADDEKEELLSLVRKNSNLLTTLINDILDLSRMQSGNYKLTLTSVSAEELCKQACKTVEARVPQGVKLSIDRPVSGKDVTFTTDFNRVIQVLINYLTNACKYTEKGSITLSYRVKDNRIEFAVTDTGTGISEDQAADIFNRFAKLDEFKQGTGLGLNICTTIASLLNGKVWLDESYKGGARFIFSQPLNLNIEGK